MLRRLESHAIGLALAFVALGGVSATALIYARGYTSGQPPIRSDAVGYYIYLPAVFLDHDLSLRRTVERSFAGNLRQAGDLRRVRHGYLGPHQIGEAIMLVPFFAAGHAVAHASGLPRDGFSRPYQVAAVAGGLLYGLAGLALLGAFLRRWFDRRVVAATLFALTFGTNLFHYLTFDAVYSHAFSFAAIAFVLWSTVRLVERPAWPRALLLGLGIGLVATVHPTNLVVVLFPLLVGIRTPADARAGANPRRASGTRRHRGRRFPRRRDAPASRLAPPHGTSRRQRIRVEPEARAHASASHRRRVQRQEGALLLDAARRACDCRARVSAHACAGAAPCHTGRAGRELLGRRRLVGVVVRGVVGQRPFVDTLPLVAVGLAALFDWARAGRARVPVVLAAALTCALALHGMAEYWLGNIPYDGTTWPIYRDSF